MVQTSRFLRTGFVNIGLDLGFTDAKHVHVGDLAQSWMGEKRHFVAYHEQYYDYDFINVLCWITLSEKA
jgi:hypothetical protein